MQSLAASLLGWRQYAGTDRANKVAPEICSPWASASPPEAHQDYCNAMNNTRRMQLASLLSKPTLEPLEDAQDALDSASTASTQSERESDRTSSPFETWLRDIGRADDFLDANASQLIDLIVPIPNEYRGSPTIPVGSP